MGIHGLWQVLEPTGRPVNIHSLRGKVLAIDVSIWLHQLVKGFRDKDGNPLPNAHLLGVFHRVCKLLNDGIKPVFVFDGGVPVLKRQTLAARRQRKLESLDKAAVSRQKILSAYLQQQLQRQAKVALPPSLRMQAQIDAFSKKSPSSSPKKRKIGPSSSQVANSEDLSRDDGKVDEDLEAFRNALIAKLEDDVDEVNVKKSISDSDDEDESSDNGYHYGVDYSENFSIIQAPSFDTLPLETQHEILFEMQESRKMNSWGKFDKMPKDLQSFSSFQMDRLVKRRTLQKKIQSVQQEMGQRHIHVQNLDDLLKMEYNNFEDKETEIKGSRDDGFVLIKSQPPPKDKKEDPKPGTSSSANSSNAPPVITIDDFIEDSFSDDDAESVRKAEKVVDGSKSMTSVKSIASDEEDADLKRAIELSLRDVGKGETGEEKISTSSEKVKLNNSTTSATATQKPTLVQIESNEEFNNATKINCSEGSQIEEENQHNFSIDFQHSEISHCAKFLDTVGFHLPQTKTVARNDSEILKDSVISSSSSNVQKESCEIKNEGSNESQQSESDDDFEEVEDAEHIQTISTTTTRNGETVATIDLSMITNSAPGEGDDMFADIFLESTEEMNKPGLCDSVVVSKYKNQNILAQVPDPTTVSPNNKVEFEENWNSDSEIEADLLEMVMKESATAGANRFAGQTSLSSNLNAKNNNDICENSEPNGHEHVKNAEEGESVKNKTEGPVRMITADYMQAQEQLNNQLGKLHSEMGQQERIATSISDQMQIETQELISLFGIPYIISPTEAESQCAFLDRACLTEGSITDDSDIWLFGGQRVYKNFFSQGQKHVELYQAADIRRVLNLDREKLIVLAMMIGSDYSDGIQGVGPVLALEILSEFTSANVESFDILLKFREWWDEIQTKPLELFAGSKLREKLRKLKLRPGFPSNTVYDAFINPAIDTSTEAFKWGNPDLDAIRTYTKQKFGWEQSKCDSLLLPVLKKRQCELDQSRQLTLDSYISFGKMPSLGGGKRKKGSKRIQTAVKRLKRVGVESHELNLSSESDSDLETEKATERSPSQKQATNRVAKSKKVLAGGKVDKGNKRQESASSHSNATEGPSTSGTSTNLNKPTLKKPEIIPQRVQSETDKIKNKQKAIEIFKRGKK